MTIWYVNRRSDGTIASAHQEMQPDYATEALDDIADAELRDWFAVVNAPAAPLTPQQKLEAAGLTVAELKQLIEMTVA